ncbi:MAG: hypothetical protein ABIP19_12630 [Dermatophilaceae bacterium]
MISALSIVTEDVGRYVHWGVVQISVTNLAIIASMIVVFVLALLVPFPHGRDSQADRERLK